MSMKNAKGLCPCLTERFAKSFENDSHAVAMKNAAAKHNMKELAVVPEAARLNPYHFSNVVKTRDITNQKSSGRCWIFAGMNLLREVVAEKLNLERFELSQNYIAFWDKYEKVNFFYEAMIDLADRDLDDRTICFLTQGGICDGGQWDMLVNVIEKYGVVPKDAMPETCQSSMTGAMNGLINTQMRRNAVILRNAVRDGRDPQPLKERMMEETYRLLCIGFSVPPTTFDFEVTDKDDKYICDRGLTPKQFYDKYIGINWDDYVSVINSPTEDKPFNATYTVPYLNNVVGGRPVLYLNTDIETLKDLCAKQLVGGELVWFGSDCGKWRDALPGVFDDQAYDYASAFGMDFEMSKEDMLNTRESAMNHAMVICAVNMVDGKPNRWKIENSWGDKPGVNGYYVMNDGWFNKMVYQAVINKKYLTPELLEALKKEPKELNVWDPMGTLAD